MWSRTLLFLFVSCMACSLGAQDVDKLSITGAYQGALNYFIKDEKIGAANIPQYEGNPIGIDSWLNLNARYKIINAGIRFDFFRNSNLLNPSGSYSGLGLGNWFLDYSLKKWNVRIGSIYNQIGSGIIYRAYEERPLFIDNALMGGQVSYEINDNWKATIFGGKQKYLFDTYAPLLYGGKLEGFIAIGKKHKVNLTPGIGWVGKKLDQEGIDRLISILRNYVGEDRINEFPSYSQAISISNGVQYRNINWYTELAYKAPELSNNPNLETTKTTGVKTQGRFVNRSGHVLYSTLSYAKKGLGITLEGKWTKNFDFRIDPTLQLNNGLIGFLPPMNHITTYRLTSRYNPASQLTEEIAIQLDLKYKLNKKYTLNLNASNINGFENELLYREIYVDIFYKPNRKLKMHIGLQREWYNQAIYEGKPKSITPLVTTWTPYVDLLYKFTRKKALKLEMQYMSTEQDYGSWWYGLVEYSMAPHWRFEGSLMYNIIPNEENLNNPKVSKEKLLYPTLGIYYQWKQTRYGLRYVKQVEGVVCTGGVCRLEPAFSGVKFEVNSIF